MNGTERTPEQWAAILKNAGRKLQKDKTNVRALRAFRLAAPHVGAQRAIEARQEFLKDVDPGTLAAFGLGAADMMSFGLGDQAARALLGEEARLTQEAAKELHPTAHLAGEVAGVVPSVVGAIPKVAAKVGLKVAPTAIGRAVQAIRPTAGRAAARTALAAAEGAGFAGAQAAGREEGSLAERGEAALEAAPFGAVLGGAAPLAAAGIARALQPVKRFAGDVLGRMAGPAASRAAPGAVPPVPGLLGVGEDIGALPTQARNIPSPRPPADPLEVPTFLRRAEAGAVTPAALRGMPVEQLQALANNPSTPAALREAALAEFARRWSTGLLAR